MTDSQRDSRRFHRCQQLKAIIAQAPQDRRPRLRRLFVLLGLRRSLG